MKNEIIKLNPNQIITLNDYPVHNEHILKIYFKIFNMESGHIMPPCPIMHRDLVIKHFDDGLKEPFEYFARDNPNAEYFLIDGNHKTTAANLTHNRIKAIDIKDNKDIKAAHEMASRGEFFSLGLDNTIEEVINDLISHFNEKKQFETVEQKTQRMIDDRILPEYMMEAYRK